MNLYDHQRKIILEDPKRTGLFLGTGSGKTRIALLLARGKTLVIAPKTQVEDKNWERELKTIRAQKKGATLIAKFDVISKENFRSNWESLMPNYDTVIVDEAHTCLGVTPNTRQRKRVTIPKTSQLFEALDEFIARTQPERIYLCTATIIKSPMTVWGAAKILGKIKGDTMESFLKFRNEYYTRLPMPGREIYAPRRDSETKDALGAIVRKLGYTGRLEDYFDVPEQSFKTVYVGLKETQKARIKKLPMEFPDPIVLLGKKHQVENGVLAGNEFSEGEFFANEKIDKILEYAEEFPRMVIFAKYRAQITAIADALIREKKTVLILTGDTKERGSVIAEANRLDECIFIAQAQISAGWELPGYPVMIFASRIYSFVDYQQGIGRILRANKLKKNLYINLVVKSGIDEAVDKSLANKQSFDERIYLKI